MKSGLPIFLLLGSLSCATPKYRYDLGQPPAARITPRTVAPTTVQPSRPAVPEINAAILEAKALSEPSRPTMRTVPSAMRPKAPIPADQPAIMAGSMPAAPASSIHPDAKRSFIFLAGGAVALIIGGDVFVVIGSLSLLIGLIFGIKRLLRDTPG